MKKTLVEKLAMVKETRSVKVVIVIATPACSITFHDMDTYEAFDMDRVQYYQAHLILEGQEHLLLGEVLQGGHQGEHVVNTKTFTQLTRREKSSMSNHLLLC